MINATNICHPTMRKKILDATKNVMKRGYCVDHVRNNQGRAIMAIRYRDGKLLVTDRNDKDIFQTVANSF